MKQLNHFLLMALAALLVAGLSASGAMAACPDPFCDSVTTSTQCILICPEGDIPYSVTVKDSCGAPVCDLTGTYLDFSTCPVNPCPNLYPDWPKVFPDSCDAATGEHHFTLKMGLQDCAACQPGLFIGGQFCQPIRVKFLDNNGTLCVEPSDYIPGADCSDFNCDASVDALDQALLDAHLDHCCDTGPCPAGPVFCDSVVTDPCLVICPQGDIVHEVILKDSCGNPICSPNWAIDFGNCPAEPCPDAHPDWPLVYPDSCDAATGTHYYSVKASSLDCVTCTATLVEPATGIVCHDFTVKFLDVNNDKCVFPDDWLQADCNDYNCDGTIGADDNAIHTDHLDHCCVDSDCPPGPVFCDSTMYDPCMVICPLGDITHEIILKDSCGNPICEPNLFLDFGNCPAEPCPNAHPTWPQVPADSCDPATGTHYFTVKASSLDCVNCTVPITLPDGTVCGALDVRFLDVNNDKCVTPNDWLNASCNDYDCDGSVTTTLDFPIHEAHLDHCCAGGPCDPGPPFCDSTMFDPCLVVCPQGDIVWSVFVKDSCGNPICDPDGTWLDFSNCAAEPCPGEHPDWPTVPPDSCHPATGEHFFSIKASSLDCIDCFADLYVGGLPCRDVNVKFLDINNDKCVTPNDWLGPVAGLPPCNDYDCDGSVTDDLDFAIHQAHLDHCCAQGPCDPGPPLCDSVETDPCLVICPRGDIVHEVVVKDSCGNPVCDPNLWLDFSQCAAEPCPGAHPDWPLVPPDSCDPATGTHYFSVKASSVDCVDCGVQLYVDGNFCRVLRGRFLDVNNDNCVTPNDFLGLAPCNDYDCDGTITAADQGIHNAHLDHCCASDPCAPGPPLCDSVTTDGCIQVCPAGDITEIVTVKDSCGNPYCDVSAVWLDFSQCPTEPCPGSHPNWPIVYPDSCDPATGDHYFTIRASSLDCIDCRVGLFVNGQLCQNLPGKFYDIDNDKCVTQADFIGNPICNDYDCNGTLDANDQALHNSHLTHCCSSGQGSIHGSKFEDLDCDGVWDANEPGLPNWQINLYQGITFVASTMTDAAGNYWFMGLAAGSYRVTETQQPGWIQTAPPTGWYDTTLNAGGTITGLVFGNTRDTCDGFSLTASDIAGTKDDFVGAEPASPGADLIPLLNCVLGSTNWFDSSLTNQCFGHTFTGFNDTACCIIGGQLCFKLRATGSIPSTDALVIAEDGQQIWGISLNTLQSMATGGADPTWTFGDSLEMCLDLQNLPANGLGITSVISALLDDDFDVKLQDDTEVDYLDLRVEFCCTCCENRGDANDDGPVNVSDLTYLVSFLFQGGPPPPCFEEGDVNGDGNVNVADLTYLVSFLFQGGPPPPPC